MIGYIVSHAEYGLGRISDFNERQRHFTVEFFSPPATLTFSSGIDRAFFPVNSTCDGPDGRCQIKERFKEQSLREPRNYQVLYPNGLVARVPETKLVLIEIAGASTPLEALSGLEIESYNVFSLRETFAEAWGQILRSGLGVKALLSSRIDLKAHQAYVAGTVLLDRQQRYLLADEVGLGKTIEAGIIVHDLLGRKPDANVLILCPGALSRQWLCELYSKFSGRVFSMPELHHPSRVAGSKGRHEIVSFIRALKMSKELAELRWDMVVIDEAHHLTKVPALYSLARCLSERAKGCLLLSALPATHREDEYLSLLGLLEPNRYRIDDPDARKDFALLYERQTEISRKLAYISRRLDDFVSDGSGADKILSKVKEMASFPVLGKDDTLKRLIDKLDPSLASFETDVRSLLHHVGDQYRINRRILRNRRRRLVGQEPSLRISRQSFYIKFVPEQFELDARNAVRRLIQSCKERGLEESVLLPLARQLLHASCDAEALLDILKIAGTSPKTIPTRDVFTLDTLLGYQYWRAFVELLWASARTAIAPSEFKYAIEKANLWRLGLKENPRDGALVEFLTKRRKTTPGFKFIVFAGFPKLAGRVAAVLKNVFQVGSIAEFNFEMTDDDKEKEVRRFRRNSQCWILVSDESGGEGRNFQFADEVVHYDLPWYVARIEQRIGRLDRLGREKEVVMSNIIVATDQDEDGLAECLEKGFCVFSKSISGLEFALRDLEDQMVLAAIDGSKESMSELVSEIYSRGESERADDESQELLDEASFEKVSAESFRRVQSTPEREILLETAFTEYFSTIGNRDTVRVHPRGESVEGVVEFRPDHGLTVELGLHRRENELIGDKRGTFRRSLAQERPDLEFFSVGNEVFDAVCSSLVQSIKGRSYAVECIANHPVWRGFEFSYRVDGKRSMLKERPGLLNHMDRVFSVRNVHVFVSDDVRTIGDTTTLLGIRRSLKAVEKDRNWWNFTVKNGKIQILSNHYQEQGWESTVLCAERLAKKFARNQYQKSLAEVLGTEKVRIDEQVRLAKKFKYEGWKAEVEDYGLLLEALENWNLDLDIAGFMSVNGQLIA